MLFDIKKLFSKGTSIGRIEYLKIVFGLLLFPMSMLIFAVIIPPNNPLCYPIAIIAVITLLVYLIIRWVAVYKRLTNIFDNTIISIESRLVIIFYNRTILLDIIFQLLLICIPGKKKSDYIISNVLAYITVPLVFILIIVTKYTGFMKFVPMKSMENTLQVRDRIILNILDKDYHRGDIIIHKTGEKGVDYIKRIIALPGEKVEIKALENGANYIFINGKLLQEPYVKSEYEYPKCLPEMICGPFIVPDNNYYVLGDNRGNSFDSRYYGTIDRSAIKGKVSHIYFPLNRRVIFETLKYSD